MYFNNCCSGAPFNLCKINPATGAVVWQSAIASINATTLQKIYLIEPLRGTDDVIALVGDTTSSGGGGSATCNITRIDSSGSKVWSFLPTSLTFLQTYQWKCLAAANGVIAYMPSNVNLASTGADMFGIDYDGSPLWSTTVAPFGGTGTHALWLGQRYPPHLTMSGGGYISLGTGATFFRRFTISTGIVAGTSNVNTSDSYVLAADQSTGKVLTVEGAATSLEILPATLVRPGGATILAGGQDRWRARWSNGQLCGANVTTGAGNFACVVYNTSPISVSSAVNNPGGYTISSANVLNCDSDGTDFYWCSVSQVTTGPSGALSDIAKFNVFKTDSSGNFIWGKVNFGTAGSNFCYGIAMSDEGYLYAAGYSSP